VFWVLFLLGFVFVVVFGLGLRVIYYAVMGDLMGIC